MVELRDDMCIPNVTRVEHDSRKRASALRISGVRSETRVQWRFIPNEVRVDEAARGCGMRLLMVNDVNLGVDQEEK